MKLSSGCEWWKPGDSVPLVSREGEFFLNAMLDARFSAFTGPGGLLGAKTENRCVVVIHRGRLQRWEVSLQEAEEELYAAIITTSSLAGISAAAIAWLNGASVEDATRHLTEMKSDGH